MFLLGFLLTLSLVYKDGAALLQCDQILQHPGCRCDSTTATVSCDGRAAFNNNTALLTEMPWEVKTLHVEGYVFSELLRLGSNEKDMALTSLKLINNSINVINKTFFDNTHDLKTLDLSNNNLTLFNPLDIFTESLKNLKTLKLEKTFFKNINCSIERNILNCSQSFSKLKWTLNGVSALKSLEKLNIANNDIWSIPDETQVELSSLPNLKVLNFSKNELTLPSLKGPFPELIELDLSANRFHSLQSDFLMDLEALQKLERLFLQDNLYICDCNMKAFLLWLQNRTLSYFVQNPKSLTCFEGYGVEDGSVLMDINATDLACKPDHYPNAMASNVVIGVLFCLIFIALLLVLFLNRSSLKKCCGGLCNNSDSKRDREYFSVGV